MPRNPFGDYASVDLSSIYTGQPGPGAITQPGAGGTTGGTTPPPAGGAAAPGTGGFPGRVTQTGSDPNIDPQAPGGSFSAASPQGQALANPDNPYLDASGSGGIAFTPNQARAWWDAWFAHPVNLLTVDPALLPGTLVLSPEEIARARQIQLDGTLAAAPENYNPLSLDVQQGSNGLSSFGGYGSAQAAIGASLDAQRAAGQTSTPAYTQYTNTLAGLGSQPPAAAPPPAPTNSRVTSPGVTDQADIDALNRYIANLSAVKNPTPQQTAELATYRQRLAEYSTRIAQPAPAPAPTMPPTAPAPVETPSSPSPTAAPTPAPVNTSNQMTKTLDHFENGVPVFTDGSRGW